MRNVAWAQGQGHTAWRNAAGSPQKKRAANEATARGEFIRPSGIKGNGRTLYSNTLDRFARGRWVFRTGFHLVIMVWFPYRRGFLLVIFNLSSTIAVRTILAIIYPATAITTWTDLHC
jgi:hypothetical protein